MNTPYFLDKKRETECSQIEYQRPPPKYDSHKKRAEPMKEPFKEHMMNPVNEFGRELVTEFTKVPVNESVNRQASWPPNASAKQSLNGPPIEQPSNKLVDARKMNRRLRLKRYKANKRAQRLEEERREREEEEMRYHFRTPPPIPSPPTFHLFETID